MSNGTRTGVVNTESGVNFRETPNGDIIDNIAIPNKTTVKIVNSTPNPRPDASGNMWMQVEYNGICGWVFAQYIKVNTPPATTTPAPQPQPPATKLLTVKRGTQAFEQRDGVWREGTWFKKHPEDSKQLGAELKDFIPSNYTYSVVIIGQPDKNKNHYHFQLAHGQFIEGKNTWYVFKDHVEIK
jgi:Bacterial SH3 domain